MLATKDPRSRPTGLLAELADRTGARAGARVAFGEPVELDGVTIIPVARARWGFGAGSGGGHGPWMRRARGGGGGGGGGMVVSPVGFIELRNGHARYRPVFDAAALVPAALAAGAAALLFLSRRLRHAGKAEWRR